jgi:HD superfamily phosphodiesterase
MVHIPRVLASPKDRFAWVIVIREMSFAGGAWILAANTMRGQNKNKLINVGRVLIAIAAIFFGVEHFLHPAGCPESRSKN